MINAIRALWRLLCIGVFVVAVILVSVFYLHWVSPKKKFHLMQTWCTHFVRLTGIQMQVSGEVLDSTCLVVANHSSFFDIFAITSIQPARFIAKEEIRSWPIFGFIAQSVNTLFIRRQDKRMIRSVNEQIAQALSRQEPIVLFPEGKCTDGLALAPFKPSLLEPAVLSQTPVQPIALSYEIDGQRTSRASYYNISLLQCLINIVTTPKIVLKATVLPAIDTAGKTRHVVAQEASQSVARALNVDEPEQVLR